MQRRLAAILAADVVNYTRHMERDEAGTLTALRMARRDDIEPVVARFEGRIFKLMGDGFLAEFASVLNAVSAAIEIQRVAAERAVAIPPVSRIDLRIGINIGDIMLDDGDVYGDGVNIAVRLQEIARPGGICISRTVRDQVRDKLTLEIADLGAIAIKNRSRPVHAFQIGLEGIPMRVAGDRSQTVTSANMRARYPMVADIAYGGYVRTMYGYYEGEYICVRPSLSRPGHYVLYPMTIEWSEECGALAFVDRNLGFEQRGVITIPTGAGYVHLLTIDAGSARLITAEHMPETHSRMFGLVMTLSNPTGRELRPAACPILIERTDRAQLAYAECSGVVPRDDTRLASFPHALFTAARAPLVL